MSQISYRNTGTRNKKMVCLTNKQHRYMVHETSSSLVWSMLSWHAPHRVCVTYRGPADPETMNGLF